MWLRLLFIGARRAFNIKTRIIFEFDSVFISDIPINGEPLFIIRYKYKVTIKVMIFVRISVANVNIIYKIIVIIQYLLLPLILNIFSIVVN